MEFGVSFFKLEPIVAPDGNTGSELKAANFVDQKDVSNPKFYEIY